MDYKATQIKKTNNQILQTYPYCRPKLRVEEKKKKRKMLLKSKWE